MSYLAEMKKLEEVKARDLMFKLALLEADEEGKWVTIRGTHVLIRDGETASQAFKRTTGKDLSEPEKRIYDKPDGDSAKSLNIGTDKDSAKGKQNMQNEPKTTRTRDVDEQPYGAPYNPTSLDDARYMNTQDPASLAHLDTSSKKKIDIKVPTHGWDKPFKLTPTDSTGEWTNYNVNQVLQSVNGSELSGVSKNDLDLIANYLRKQGYTVSVRTYNRSIGVRGKIDK
jgi:hypothetical protein